MIESSRAQSLLFEIAVVIPARLRALASSLSPPLVRRVLSLMGGSERQATREAMRTGPPYRPSHEQISIDLTTACDLGCVDCNRSCSVGQAPAQDHLSLSQVRCFLDESRADDRRWRVIQLEGGEPTLNPELHAIVDCLTEYQRKHAPSTVIRLISNGYQRTSLDVLAKLPRSVKVVVTAKRKLRQVRHCAFNLAPIDLPEFDGTDFSKGCFLPAREGLGLTRHGYYPHPICGGIDRVFGFDIGRRSLPPVVDDLRDQFARLCPLCGLFRFFASLDREHPDMMPGARERPYLGSRSPSWKRAYARYWKERPQLSVYGS